MSEEEQLQAQPAEEAAQPEQANVEAVEAAAEPAPAEPAAEEAAEGSASPTSSKPQREPQTKPRRQNGKVRQPPAAVEEPQHTRLRLLCPLNLAGGLIGKKGEVIMKIRKETNTQVAVEDYVAGSEDRVVTIIAERGEPGSECTDGEDALCSVFDRMCALAAGGRRNNRAPSSKGAAAEEEAPAADKAPDAAAEDAAAAGAAEGAPKAEAETPAENGGHAGSGGGSENGGPPPELAPEGEAEAAEANGHASDAGESEASSAAAAAAAPLTGPDDKPLPAAVRLLVDSSQMGYIVGKGGATIKSTTQQSGATIRILPKAELPPCACVTDEVVLVTGDQDQVKAALRLLGAQQRRHPPRSGPLAGQGGPLLLGHAAHPDLSIYHGVYGGPGAMPAHPPMQAPMFHGIGMPNPVEITFRLLAPVGKTGNIIGRSGEHIKRIRAETGARIKVHEAMGESEERLVSVTSQEEALAPYCAAQDALIRCVISLTSDEPPTSIHRVRLLTSQTSVGVVLGKKGQTVTQLRAETGAVIKVLPADGLSMDETNPDEVVQVEGNMQQCITALRGVATLLRGWQIRRQARSMVQVSPSGSPPPGPPVPIPMPLSPGGVLPPPPPPPPGSPGMVAFNPYAAMPNGAMVPPHLHPHAAFRYSLTPLQVGAVIGRGGSHITQIRQMSGARVQLPGESDEKGERKLEISGTPEQCQAAHHLVNSYLAMGRAPPAFPVMG